MTVICPNCKTTYNLPDDKARPGAKLRCTVCRQVFVLSDPDAPPAEPEVPSVPEPAERPLEHQSAEELSISLGGDKPKTGRRKSRIPVIVLLLLAVALGAAGAVSVYTPWLDPLKSKVGLGEAEPGSKEDADTHRVNTVADLQLQGIRQYMVNNEKTGKPISVIEGRVANGSNEPKDLIEVEVLMYDDANTEIFSKSQFAGSMVSLFQLQVLSEQELENALNNQLDIVTNNTNVPPGGTVPFMVVVYDVPPTAVKFNIKIIGARPSAQKP